jgi:hopene-associated glycosyltransferase HpnB
MSTFIEFAIALLVLVIWIALTFAWGGFWQVWRFDADRDALEKPQVWPRITAIVPARNEAAIIGEVVASLARQEYSGDFSIVVVDDHSEDGTADLARRTAADANASSRVLVIMAPVLASGWTGKLWALNTGVAAAQAQAPEFFWFTDADVVHAPDTLSRLVARAQRNKLDLTSLMVLLQSHSFAERLLIPPFLYFFLMLYPPGRIANPSASTAGAAGGCILLRRAALERIGGFASIRGEVIDDCALARAVKRSGGRIWLGLTRASRSLRHCETLDEMRDMVARTAFTQLGYSSLRLLGTLLGLLVTFVFPVALTLSPHPRVWPLGLLAWCLMSVSFLPTVVYCGVSPVYGVTLPLTALFYAQATVLSAVRYWLGRGAQWKGRSQAR